MSNENAPTGGEGVSTTFGTADFDDRPTGEDLDALFEALADEQRRRVLAYLDECDGDVAAFSDLVDAVADRSGAVSDASNAVSNGNVDAVSHERDGGTGARIDGRERIAVRLRHAHLPKLVDAGLVEFDARSETVRYRGGPVTSSWIELVQAHEPGTDR